MSAEPSHREFKIFVEGGGHPRLDLACRRAFGRFFERAELGIRMPKVAACGSRSAAYKDFCYALDQARSGDTYLLLVDSESAFVAQKGHTKQAIGYWLHVKEREGDRWEKPANGTEEMLHFMVECMENWFLAEPQVLKSYFGKDFQIDCIKPATNIETVSKVAVYRQLENATASRLAYSKGKDSFRILEKLNPFVVAEKSTSAKRLIEHVRALSGNRKPLFPFVKEKT